MTTGSIRICAWPRDRGACLTKLSASNPGALCRRHAAIEAEHALAVRDLRDGAADKRRGYAPGPRQAVAVIPKPATAAGATIHAPAVTRVRLEEIPASADNRTAGRTARMFEDLMTLPAGEALRVECVNWRQLANTRERLRQRFKRVRGRRFVWTRDKLLLYLSTEIEKT